MINQKILILELCAGFRIGRLRKNKEEVRGDFIESMKRTLPTTMEEFEEALRKERYKRDYISTLKGTIGTLITVAAIAVLVATLLLPVLQIYGTSMTPSLIDGDIVLSLKNTKLERQDIVAFYYNNKVLVKRVIAREGEWVNIDRNGKVSVNGQELDEPYIKDMAFGECDLELPYQVPDGRFFVMGDHRAVSLDSRSSTIGCIAEEQIVGKLEFVIWPFSRFGSLK